MPKRYNSSCHSSNFGAENSLQTYTLPDEVLRLRTLDFEDLFLKGGDSQVAIVKWEPFFRPWPQLFEDWGWPEVEFERGLDVYETEDEVVVEAHLPGIPKDKIEITAEGGIVRIKGEVEEKEEEEKKKKYYRKEAKRSFYYSTSVPSRGQWDKAEAEMENGIVRVRIPKAEEEKPKKIEIKTK